MEFSDKTIHLQAKGFDQIVFCVAAHHLTTKPSSHRYWKNLKLTLIYAPLISQQGSHFSTFAKFHNFLQDFQSNSRCIFKMVSIYFIPDSRMGSFYSRVLCIFPEFLIKWKASWKSFTHFSRYSRFSRSNGNPVWHEYDLQWDVAPFVSGVSAFFRFHDNKRTSKIIHTKLHEILCAARINFLL